MIIVKQIKLIRYIYMLEKNVMGLVWGGGWGVGGVAYQVPAEVLFIIGGHNVPPPRANRYSQTLGLVGLN